MFEMILAGAVIAVSLSIIVTGSLLIGFTFIYMIYSMERDYRDTRRR